MKVLLSALDTFLDGTDLHTTVGGRIYDQEAPQGVTRPFATVSIITYQPEYWFRSERFEDAVLQVSAFAETHLAAYNLFDDITATLDDIHPTLTVTGYRVHRFERSVANIVKDPDEDIWQVNVDYRVELEAN